MPTAQEMKSVGLDAKREEFRQYLEKEGVLEYLTKHLVPLYENPSKPTSALDFLKQNFGGKDLETSQLKNASLTIEIQQLKKTVEKLEGDNKELLDKVETLEKELKTAREKESTFDLPLMGEEKVDEPKVKNADQEHASGKSIEADVNESAGKEAEKEPEEPMETEEENKIDCGDSNKEEIVKEDSKPIEGSADSDMKTAVEESPAASAEDEKPETKATVDNVESSTDINMEDLPVAVETSAKTEGVVENKERTDDKPAGAEDTNAAESQEVKVVPESQEETEVVPESQETKVVPEPQETKPVPEPQETSEEKVENNGKEKIEEESTENSAKATEVEKGTTDEAAADTKEPAVLPTQENVADTLEEKSDSKVETNAEESKGTMDE